jgi:hypothetical protein
MTESKQKQDKKGVVLFIVIGTVFIAVFLANVVLSIITSHGRLTHHQVSRIQAYYACMAGVNYALEQLRTGAWNVASCPNPNGCLVNENSFPASIRSFDGSNNRQFRVIFCPSGATCQSTTVPCNPPPGINFCVNVTTNYTYTP